MGKTLWLDFGNLIIWKHPHVHGEDGGTKELPPENMETPPRAWGRPNSLNCNYP